MDTPAWSRKLKPTFPRPRTNSWSEHEETIEQTIAYHTRSASRNSALGGLEDDDLRQELRLALWESLERFDPARAALTTFLDRVAANAVLSLIRQATAQCRDCRRHGPSLNAPDWETQRGPRAGDVPDQQRPYAPTAEITDVLQRRELAAEVVAWVATLPDPLRQVADLLRQHRESKVAQLLGLSPRKVRDQVERLRRLYEDRRLRGDR